MLPVDRTLGICWNIEEDTFNLVFDARKFPENIKGVLSSIATIYDSLGFASTTTFITRAKNQPKVVQIKVRVGTGAPCRNKRKVERLERSIVEVNWVWINALFQT